MASAKRVSREEYEHLCRMIEKWNENRLELFEISMPNENLEFEGIMRFYFQSPSTGTEKVATKCIRVSSNASTEMVIEALVQKFRPDMRMLTCHSSYALYEVHRDEERKLEKKEHPLMVQLSWSRGEKEGRFLLRSEISTRQLTKTDKRTNKKDMKKFSKRKKTRKEKREKDQVPVDGEADATKRPGKIAQSLYTDMPESRFTRSISVKNRRNQIIREVLDERQHLPYHGEEMPNDATMRVYADFVVPDVPCKSLLISTSDTASQVVRSALEKYSLREDPSEFCLVQVTMPPTFHFGSEPHLNIDYTERILGDTEYPLQVHSDWVVKNSNTGASIQFQLRRRASFNHKQRRSHSRSHSPEDDPMLPALVEIFRGAQSPPQNPRRFPLSPEQTEIGSNVALLDPKSYICLTSGGIRARHCVIACSNGIFRISPLDKTALIFVNAKQVKEPTLLPHNAEIRLGEREAFRFFAPMEMKSNSLSMHTLPTNIGRPNSSHGMNSVHSVARPDNISKAFSVEDISMPGQRSIAMSGRLKDKAYSERNLKADEGSSSGYGSGRALRKFSDTDFIPEGKAVSHSSGPGTKYNNGGSFGTFPSHKKQQRNFSAPVQDVVDASDKGGVESERTLPASLSFYQAQENILLQNMISEVNGYLLQFKLAPAFGLYMVVKHHLSPEFQPSSSITERKKCLVLALKNTITQFRRAVKESRSIAGALAFWLANCSEFFHFLKCDPQLSQFAGEYEASLTQLIHTAYKNFTQCMLKDLNTFMPAFYDESNEADSEDGYLSGGESTSSTVGLKPTLKEPDVVCITRDHPSLPRQTSMTGMYWSVAGSKVRRRGRVTMGDVLMTLSSTVSLLKKCHVNPTLSIMIFSLLFRYISTKLFNKLVSDSEGKVCSSAVGQKMRKRLERVREWAEKEGMELPADDHLCMIVQAANLLQAVKKLPENAPNVFSTCSKLNSLQIATILHRCSQADGDMTPDQGFVKQMILLAQTHTDVNLQNEGMELKLEEDPNLELPFLIPLGGYSSDSLRGIPLGLQDYLDPMISSGMCKLVVGKDSSKMWVSPAKISASAQSLTDKSATSPSYLDGNVNPPTLGAQNQETKRGTPNARYMSELPKDSRIAIVHVSITKEHKSLGISIIGGKQHGEVGIFVKSMVEGGAAHLDGRLKPGDQIVAVDNVRLDGCTQEEAADILRGTGKVVNLTVAKQAATHLGLLHLIQTSSPRYSRKHDDSTSSHARKAMRRQKREQRERQHHERYQHREFRLERRKPASDFLRQELSRSHGHLAMDSSYPGTSNPQFTKWIMEQNELYHDTDRGSEMDVQSCISSLSNIPERDRPVSPGTSYTTSSTQFRRNSSDRGYGRPPTPPVRDSEPSRPPPDHHSSYTNIDGDGSTLALDAPTVSEAPSKFSEYSTNELDNILRSLPPPASSTGAHMLPYKDSTFSSLSSQLTLESQQMLTPYSQQHNQSQQQMQQLDKLSMDVMLHTQLSGASMQGGITAMVPRLKKAASHLDRSGLKELEMDEIDLEKQRIQLMFYQQQQQKSQNDSNLNHQNGQDNGAEEAQTNDEALSEDDDPITVLKQELESLEQIVSDQRKKFREIKFSREREELSLKKIEMRFREQELMNGTFTLNPSDQHRWQAEQKKRLREFERLKKEQKERLQQIEYNEHRARSKLKAYETQVNETREQLKNMLASLQTPANTVSSAKPEYQTYDVPSKLVLERDVGSGQNPQKSCRNDIPSTTFNTEWDWGSKSIGDSHIMSVENMSMGTFEPPDIAREIIHTMSESNLTEPTQDDSRPVRGTTTSYYKPQPELYAANSKITLDTDRDELLSEQDDRLRRGYKEEQGPSLSTVDTMDSFPSKGMDRVIHYVQPEPPRERIYQEPRVIHGAQPVARRQQQIPASGSTLHNQVIDETHIYDEPPLEVGNNWNKPVQNNTGAHPHATYDVPASARAVYMQPHSVIGHHYLRNSRSRAVQQQPQQRHNSNSPNSSADYPVKDNPRTTSVVPDVVPTSVPPWNANPLHQRQVVSGERSVSPGNRYQQQDQQPPNPQSSSYTHYAVPTPRGDRDTTHVSSRPDPNTTSPVPVQQSPVPLPQQTAAPVLSSPTAENQAPNQIYDHPKPHLLSSNPHSPIPLTRPATHDRDTSLRVAAHRSGLVQNVNAHTVHNAPTVDVHPKSTPIPKPKMSSNAHRYGTSRPGMGGHSYTKGRPEPAQQMPLDKLKQYMDHSRSYKNQGARHPERIQRQQTEL